MKLYKVDFRNKVINEVEGNPNNPHTYKTLKQAKALLKKNLNHCILSEKKHLAELQNRIDEFQFKLNEL